MNKEDQLKQFTERFTKTFGANAVALILYGSAAGAEFNEHYSDFNLLCVLGRVGSDELAASEGLFHWWMERHNPAPVLMTEVEVAGSSDCFPIEYTDMQSRRRVLHGKDVIDGLVVDRSFYRAQVEYELRTKLLRLRQKAAGVLHDKKLLVQLMADSVSTFLVLARHGLLLAGHEGGLSRRETVRLMATHFGVEPAAFEPLLDVREEKTNAAAIDAAGVFARYLTGVQRLVDAVDALHK